MRERILDTALRLFRTFRDQKHHYAGYCPRLRHLQKTVYEHFSDKREELVEEVTRFMISAHGHNLEVCNANGKDAMRPN